MSIPAHAGRSIGADGRVRRPALIRAPAAELTARAWSGAIANKISDFGIRMDPIVKRLMNSPLHWILSFGLMLIRFKGGSPARHSLLRLATGVLMSA
jgi:hypothetical protein